LRGPSSTATSATATSADDTPVGPLARKGPGVMPPPRIELGHAV
jgi:hypothetical protein